MPRVVTITGNKESGKTTVIEKLVGELKNRGYKVGSIKHIPDDEFTIDSPQTDTWRHSKAGSEKVIALSPEEVATIEKRNAGVQDLLHELTDLDFVILEGFKGCEKIARIVIARTTKEAEDLGDEFTIGFIGEGKGSKPIMDPENPSEVADLVEEKAIMAMGGLNCGECGYETCREYVIAAANGKAPADGCVALKGSVSVEVDGKRVPLKPFIQDLVSKTITGMISSLKKSDGDVIKIKVEKNEG